MSGLMSYALQRELADTRRKLERYQEIERAVRAVAKDRGAWILPSNGDWPHGQPHPIECVAHERMAFQGVESLYDGYDLGDWLRAWLPTTHWREHGVELDLWADKS